MIGALAGAALGLTMHRFLPGALQKFIPFPLPTRDRVDTGLGRDGGGVWRFAFSSRSRRSCVSGASRRCSLCAPRWMKMPRRVRRDLATWLVYLFIAASLTAFAISQAETWTDGLFVAGGLGLAIADPGRRREAADFSGAQTSAAKLELRPAAGTGQSAPAEQPHPASHALVRPGHLSAPHHLPDARRAPDPVPLDRREQSAQHLSLRHPAGSDQGRRRSR